MAAYTDFDLEIFRDDETFTIAVKTAAGAPQDITGWTLYLTARERLTDTTPVIALTSPAGGITLSAPLSAGLAVAVLTPALFAALAHREYRLWVDIRGKDAAGKAHTLLSGRWTVYPNATRTLA